MQTYADAYVTPEAGTQPDADAEEGQASVRAREGEGVAEERGGAAGGGGGEEEEEEEAPRRRRPIEGGMLLMNPTFFNNPRIREASIPSAIYVGPLSIAYVSIRQHTAAYVSILRGPSMLAPFLSCHLCGPFL
jgi:hypothetical protein